MARSSFALAVLLVAVAAVSAQSNTPVYSNVIAPPETTPVNPLLRPSTGFLDLNDPSFTPPIIANVTPTQVHLSLAGPGCVFVMWATGVAQVGKGTPTPYDPSQVASVVKYGTSPSALNSYVNGQAEVYSQIYNTSVPLIGGSTVQNYTSPRLHNVRICGLTPTQTYFYQVGDNSTFSKTYNFTAVLPAGALYPQRILCLADWGLSQNSSSTLQHVLQSAQGQQNSPVIFYNADYSYADTWYANGTASNPNTGFEGSPAGTWQPVWDSFMRFLEPLVSNIPWLGNTGNHEIEMQSDHNNTIFASVLARWKYPNEACNGSFFYYSANVGPVHGIFLSPYQDYTPGSPQWEWLALDLQNVNRQVTPWVVVNIHNPWYTTSASFKQYEQMRASMEPLTYRYGADIFLYGHVHSYERTYPVAFNRVDPCGAVHLTIGDAGNSEGLSALASNITQHSYEDFNGGCPVVANTSVRPSWNVPVDPEVSDPFGFFKAVLTYDSIPPGNGSSPGSPPGYCHSQQPDWSAFRESSFGHGVLDFINSTHAQWQWHRNQDSEQVIADDVWIIRDAANCPNKATGSWPISSAGLTFTSTPIPSPAS